jgi:histidyl-tRNA synthetase
MRYSAPRGTQDVLPRDIGKWRRVEDHVRRVCDLYGYEEIRTPVFEQTELFVRGIGEVTDIVEKEMYTFADKRGRSMTLRPEGTAPVARAFIKHKMFSEPQPVKLYYIGPMFRYERPQAGRQRQFSQFGVEAFGSGDPILDAEIIDLAYTLYRGLGLDNSIARINTIGCPVCRPRYNEHIRSALSTGLEQLCDNCRSRYERNPMRILDCKSESCRKAAAEAGPIWSFLCAECAEHFSSLEESLRAMSVPFELDPTIVRGFDYYTRTVFEFIASGIGAQDAIGGGGRYDGLIESCGGPPTPGVGFAAGIDRLLLAIEACGAISETQGELGCFVAAIGEGARLKAADLVASLRRSGVSADMDYMDRSLRAQMRHADRNGARVVAILGEDELRAGAVQVKDMKEGEQWEVPLEGAADAICAFLQPACGKQS